MLVRCVFRKTYLFGGQLRLPAKKKVIETYRLCSEDGSVTLHDLLHITTDNRSVLRSARLSNFIQNSERIHAGIFGNLLMWLTGLGGLGNVMSASSAEDDDIEE